jgi:hypothetical protein
MPCRDQIEIARLRKHIAKLESQLKEMTRERNQRLEKAAEVGRAS